MADAQYRGSARRPLCFAIASTIAILIGVLAFVAGHKVRRMQEIAHRMQSGGRFAQLALALRNYHLDQGAFPPLRLSRNAGAPAYSWRVALLPYLELNDVYRMYDVSEPWDGPTNRALAESMLDGAPEIFRSPEALTANPYCSNYLGISESDLTWPGKKPLMSYLVTSGSSKFLLVEAPDSDIHWMEPRDILSGLTKE